MFFSCIKFHRNIHVSLTWISNIVEYFLATKNLGLQPAHKVEIERSVEHLHKANDSVIKRRLETQRLRHLLFSQIAIVMEYAHDLAS